MGTPMTRPEARGALVVSRVTAAAGALLALQVVFRMIVVPQSTWWEDDFLLLSDARERGLTPAFLFQDYNDHLQVVGNLFWWLLSRVTDSSWAPAAVLLIVWSTIASATFYLLLREVFGNRPGILVPFAVYLFSPLGLIAVTWLCPGLNLLPMQAAVFTMCWGMVRYLRTHGRRWLAISIAANVFGLLNWEKGALGLPVALGIQLLVVEAGTPWHDRFAGLRRHWRAWGTHVLLVGAYAVAYLLLTDGSERVVARQSGYVSGVLTSVSELLLPGLVGAPWHAGDALNTLYPDPGRGLAVGVAVAMGLFVVATVWRNGRIAVGPWALAVVYLGLDLGLLLWGRGAYLTLVARDSRYVADAVPVILLCACAAVLPVRGGAAGEPAARSWLPGMPRWVPGAVGGTVVAVAGVVMSLQLLPVVDHEEAGEYVASVMARTEPDPGSSILDTPTPNLVAGKISHRRLLLAMGREVTFDQPGLQLLRYDDRGRLVPVELTDVALDERGPVPGCGWQVDRSGTTLLDVPVDREDGIRVLRVDVVTGVAGTLTLEVNGATSSLDVPSGLSVAWFPVASPSGDVSATFAADDDTAAGACVAEIVAGAP